MEYTEKQEDKMEKEKEDKKKKKVRIQVETEKKKGKGDAKEYNQRVRQTPPIPPRQRLKKLTTTHQQ